jgi:hypothetical protein
MDETLYLLLRVQECRFITPQGAGPIVFSMGDGIITHLSFRFPDPTRWGPANFFFFVQAELKP